MTLNFSLNDSPLFANPKGSRNPSDLSVFQMHQPAGVERMYRLTGQVFHQRLALISLKEVLSTLHQTENRTTDPLATLIALRAAAVQSSQKLKRDWVQVARALQVHLVLAIVCTRRAVR
jgi:hypothetical protein